jgi:acetyltransferase-like isoleucine patch superfamily enzyme
VNFKKIGKNTNISPMARFYNPEVIEVGDNTRIDDFCVISGGAGITIGSHCHIACGCYLFGGAGIVIADFVEISARLAIYTKSDDYSGKYLSGPTIPEKYKGLDCGTVSIHKHCLIGVNATIMPGVTIGVGVAIGAYSFVKRDCLPWSIYVGNPAKWMKPRSKEMLKLEQPFLEEYENTHNR